MPLPAVRWLLAAKLALVSGFYPVDSPMSDGRQWVETIAGEERHREEIIRIHSVVKRKQRDLDEASAWSLAAAISDEARKHDLDPLLVLALINVESRFQPERTSPHGARGLMQILPFVGSDLASRADLGESWEGERSLDDPILNVKLGIFYLGSLMKQFKNLELALTAYNWGPTRLQSRIEEDEPISLDYAQKVLSYYQKLRHRFGTPAAG
jgi:soluble lytic murein transglycosylase